MLRSNRPLHAPHRQRRPANAAQAAVADIAHQSASSKYSHFNIGIWEPRSGICRCLSAVCYGGNNGSWHIAVVAGRTNPDHHLAPIVLASLSFAAVSCSRGTLWAYS